MSELLATLIEAHGGLERWHGLRSVTAKLSTGGALWDVKRPGFISERTVTADLRSQLLSVQMDEGRRLFFSPERVWSEQADGEVTAWRNDPAASFAGQNFESAWDELDAMFFSGEALWTYLTQPFLYARPGVRVEEVAPWQEGGETWRSLEVTLPPDLVSHTRIQTTRVGPDGLIRRHDYSVDILGGSRGANYASEYRNFDGIMVPTRRRVFPADENWQAMGSPLLVTIDISDVRFD